MDIEGTITSISFVQDVLFPFAKSHLAEYLHEHKDEPELVKWASVCQKTVLEEAGSSPSFHELPDILKHWIEQDRKHFGLKAIQGMIWANGYREGTLIADLYEDVLPCLNVWREKGLDLGIFSSGSEQAQRLLVAHTEKGDMTSYFSHFFDTRVGNKGESRSYFKIGEEIGLETGSIMFLSDVEAELDAAAHASFKTTQIVRPGTCPGTRHPLSPTFTGVSMEG